MSRIRSIHPGLWTDEAFVALSAFSRLLFIGMWNECDDKGIFPWSPLKLKMRVLPADSVDAAELLAEIEAAGLVYRYEIDGKSFGAVRNFAKFQRPKKPNDIYSATAEAMLFAGHGGETKDDKPKSVPHQFPTSSEKSPQMEDGGGNSVAKATATSGDPDKIFWDGAKGYLGTGKGGFINKLCGQYGRQAVADALTTAMLTSPQPPDRSAYLVGILKRQPKSEPVIGI